MKTKEPTKLVLVIRCCSHKNLIIMYTSTANYTQKWLACLNEHLLYIYTYRSTFAYNAALPIHAVHSTQYIYVGAHLPIMSIHTVHSTHIGAHLPPIMPIHTVHQLTKVFRSFGFEQRHFLWHT